MTVVEQIVQPERGVSPPRPVNGNDRVDLSTDHAELKKWCHRWRWGRTLKYDYTIQLTSRIAAYRFSATAYYRKGRAYGPHEDNKIWDDSTQRAGASGDWL